MKYTVTRRVGLRAGLLLLPLIFSPASPALGFGGSGPFTHINITEEAFRRFTADTGWELDVACAELMIQGSVFPDRTEELQRWQAHCDNSDFAGCSFRLDQLKANANAALTPEDALADIGRSLHVVQDFYAHSNYVEQAGFSMIPAPIAQFKDFPPPRDLQSGFFPDLYPDISAQVACYLVPESEYRYFILGATHACINKDSARAVRGGRFIPDGFGITYHDLAAEYAILASVDLLKYYSEHSPWFRTCMRPYVLTRGCNQATLQFFR